ncbi:M48 family metalloprotease [Streptomyces gamaensis]|uniref:M48 family metalloprotease n=1 Tax=Streptomyces gamaensis TaxID=1763542 RepID=A0ABW0YRL5_9ACTN
MAASSFVVYEGIYVIASGGSALLSALLTCRSQALAQQPVGIVAYARALHQAAECGLGQTRIEAWWGLLGVGVLVLVAGAIFWAQPWWYKWHRNLTELTGTKHADLVDRLEGVRRQTGTGPVVWLLQPDNRVSGYTFGRPGRRCIAVSGGTAAAAVNDPATFKAVVLHELAHVKNRDIDQTHLTLAIWRAFVVVALLPLAILLIFSRVMGAPQPMIWRMAAIALIVYLLRYAILRSREFDADARAQQFEPAARLGDVLTDRTARSARRVRRLIRLHPSRQERAAALVNPAPLHRFRFWDGLAIGLVAALGASAVREITTLLTATVGVRHSVPAIVFAAFAGGALTVGMWRSRLPETGTVAKGWAPGLGLGLGLALGPIIAPTSYTPALAPDHPSLAAVGVLAVWTGAVTLIFTPLPVWIGLWASAWQQRADGTASRVPARGAMAAAAIGAWAVMACGLYFLLDNFTFVDGASATDEWQRLPEAIRGTALVVAGSAAGWVVFLAVVAVPLAAALARRRRRRVGAQDTAVRSWRRRPPTVLCLAGSVIAVALTVAVSALAHARIADVVRWSPDFESRLALFDMQAIVVVAVACAFVAAVMARSVLDLVISVLAGAVVAAIGDLALENVLTMGHCVAWLSIPYTNPPGGACLSPPDAQMFRPVVLGAALLSLLVVPAAYAVRTLLLPRIRLARWPAGLVALGRLAAAVAVVSAVTGTALWGPSASAQGVVAAGDIGHDGWIHGNGYDVRLVPSWYDLDRAGKPGPAQIIFPFDGATISITRLVGVTPAQIADYRSYLLRLGARPDALDGVPGLLVSRSGLPGSELAQWFIARGSVAYGITLNGAPTWPGDSPYLRHEFTVILSTWHWTDEAWGPVVGARSSRWRAA